MAISPIEVFILEFGTSCGAYAMLWRWQLKPFLANSPAHSQLSIVTFPLVFQFVGLTTLVPKVNPNMFEAFAWTVSLSNFVTIRFAFLLLCLCQRRSASVVAVGWIITVVVILIGAATAYRAFADDVFAKLGPHWYTATCYVPLQATSHALIVVTLRKRTQELLRA